MSYFRVNPRDLFNESKLLKCLGRIALLIHDNGILGLTMTHENERSGYCVEQSPDDGSIYVSNLYFHDDACTPIYFYHPLNNKSSYPIIMRYKDEEYFPFNESGQYQLDKRLFLKS